VVEDADRSADEALPILRTVMPSLDAYQGLKLDDEDGIDAFLMAHWFKHQGLAYAASLAGVSVGSYNFRDYPDDTWFANHGSSHQILYQFQVPDQTVDMTVLTNFSWDTQENFDVWMHGHTLIHRLLDQHFVIFS
jgi:hypothetical protein